MARTWRTVRSVLAGAAAGYVGLFVVANLEERQHYTVRSLLTGRTAINEIVVHPVDQWVAPLLFAVFVGGGAVAGAWYARRSNRSVKARPEDDTVPRDPGVWWLPGVLVALLGVLMLAAGIAAGPPDTVGGMVFGTIGVAAGVVMAIRRMGE